MCWFINLVDSLDHIYDWIRCLSYLNSMSDIANKKYQILVHAITFNIIVFSRNNTKRG